MTKISQARRSIIVPVLLNFTRNIILRRSIRSMTLLPSIKAKKKKCFASYATSTSPVMEVIKQVLALASFHSLVEMDRRVILIFRLIMIRPDVSCSSSMQIKLLFALKISGAFVLVKKEKDNATRTRKYIVWCRHLLYSSGTTRKGTGPVGDRFINPESMVQTCGENSRTSLSCNIPALDYYPWQILDRIRIRHNSSLPLEQHLIWMANTLSLEK
mmetsp:Transcript_44764/g.108557  ORF Transcript_44764/g.108557 Transcript_44764/m.108557 type:complete len:215 (-) Transcript_44764:856-1500(-)